MQMIYEKRRAALERLMMAFKATSEPKLRAEMRSDTTRTTIRELTGMSQPGRTYVQQISILSEPHPKLNDMTHVFDVA